MTDDTQHTCWYADEELGIVTDGKMFWHESSKIGASLVSYSHIENVPVPYGIVKRVLEKKESEKKHLSIENQYPGIKGLSFMGVKPK